MNGGGLSSRVPIPNNVRKIIQDIREITGKQHSDDDVYAVLKECSMDPNETAQKLLYLGINLGIWFFVFVSFTYEYPCYFCLSHEYSSGFVFILISIKWVFFFWGLFGLLRNWRNDCWLKTSLELAKQVTVAAGFVLSFICSCSRSSLLYVLYCRTDGSCLPCGVPFLVFPSFYVGWNINRGKVEERWGKCVSTLHCSASLCLSLWSGSIRRGYLCMAADWHFETRL